MSRSPAIGRRLQRGAFLAATALLTGCATLRPPRVAAPVVYVLNALPPNNGVTHGRGRLVLAVSAPRAQAGFDTARMVYVRRRYEIEYFAKNRWVEPPAHMLAPLLVQALEQTGDFAAVVSWPSAVPTNLRLDTELTELQQDFRTHPSRVELGLRAQLTDLHDGRVLATRRFLEVEPAPSDNPYGGVVAANRAARRLLAQLVQFCARAAQALH